MRTLSYFFVVVGLTTVALLPAGADPVPTNSDGVKLEIQQNVAVTNWTYPGTNAVISNVTVAPVQVSLPPYLGMERLNILVSTNVAGPWTTNSSSATTNTPGPNNLVGTRWNATNVNGSQEFYRAEITPLTDYKRRVVTVLNRLGYGQTPELLKAFLGTNSDGIIGGEGATGATMDIEAWVNAQLNPSGMTETVSNQFPTAIIAGVGGSDMFTRLGAYNSVILSNTTITNVGFTNGTYTQLTWYTIPGETNEPGTLAFHDFRAWYAMHCIGADRQLLEVLNYFCENHFVSQWSKLRQEYQGGFNGQQSEARDRIPTKFEAWETVRWRELLMDPQCTFSNLLIKHIESESEIVYLDTNDSVGNGSNVANENYMREILELFTMGVDNGYDQGDIVAGSLAWTGWDMEKVPEAEAFNLFAIAQNSANNLTGQQSRNRGVYARQYRYNRHGNKAMFVFYHRNPNVSPTGGNYPNGGVTNSQNINGNYRVDPRFNGSGMTPSYRYDNKAYGTNTGTVGRYGLYIPVFPTPAGQSNGGTNGIEAAYMIARHLADLPYTQEFISVKLCRLLVADNFVHGYDFSDGVVTPEEQLVWECMLAWQTNTPKGQIYKVVETIVNSDLFKNSYGQKVKTPYEFAISAVRALRYPTNGVPPGSKGGPNIYTATSDGYSIASGHASRGGFGTTNTTGGAGNWHNGSTRTGHPMNRMGLYLIFDREEPDGYPETSTVYVGAGGLVERSRWLAMMMDDPNAAGATSNDGVDGGNYTRSDPVGLIKQFNSNSAKLNDPDFVARFFLAILFPGEGQATLDEYRRVAVDILRTSASGNYPSNLNSGSTAEYDRRVRRMVAALMQMPQFNEQ